MKKSINDPNHWSNLGDQSELEKFERKIPLLSINEELIQFLEKTINSKNEVDEKILYLIFAKKALMHSERKPEIEHFRAFREEYQMDKENFKPQKWIEVELEFWNNIKALKSEKMSSKMNITELSLNKGLLTQEAVQGMFSFSRTTLNRRIAEGMPFHQIGKSKYFFREEISEWVKEYEAA